MTLIGTHKDKILYIKRLLEEIIEDENYTIDERKWAKKTQKDLKKVESSSSETK